MIYKKTMDETREFKMEDRNEDSNFLLDFEVGMTSGLSGSNYFHILVADIKE